MIGRLRRCKDKIEQSKAEEAAQSVVPGTVRVAAEQAENFPARHETYGKYGIGLHRKCLCALKEGDVAGLCALQSCYAAVGNYKTSWKI